jgi:hypothetical protein
MKDIGDPTAQQSKLGLMLYTNIPFRKVSLTIAQL